MSSRSKLRLHESSASNRGASPWSRTTRVKLLLWEYAWAALCYWTPKPLNRWRLCVLRRFGGVVRGNPFVHPRARIQIPWNLVLEDLACVGDRANLYSLDRITLGRRSLVAQEAYLCTGTHDLASAEWPLLSAPIEVGAGAFIGARAFVLPGVVIGEGAVVGACSVVTRNVPLGGTVRGNPAH